jgi:hypothetical protein
MQVIGAAMNEKGQSEPAPTTVVLYLSGVFSRVKQSIAQFPVKGMTGTDLAEMMESVAKAVESSGLELLAFITDNNKVLSFLWFSSIAAYI